MAEGSNPSSDVALNGDMTRPARMDTNALEWQESPSGQVLRKRLHLVGGAESGQVTSLVRYLPGASFPEHPHPEGEEIFVLEGIFSDHSGDAAAGTHLLNPEGFRHAPFSEAGCLIFVKLRQYAGEGRPHRSTPSDDLPWTPTIAAGVDERVLFEDARFPDRTVLERWAPGAAPSARAIEGGMEIYVIEGEISVGERAAPAGTWLRLPPGEPFSGASERGCLLYVKTGGVAALRSA